MNLKAYFKLEVPSATEDQVEIHYNKSKTQSLKRSQNEYTVDDKFHPLFKVITFLTYCHGAM